MRKREFLALTAAVSVAGPVFAEDEAKPVVIEMAQGAEDAPVTMIEYASYTCPHCANWHKETYPKVKADFIDTGKVRFIIREVYFDRPGLWAGMIARCGGPEKYFGMADLLFARQSEWARAESGAEIAENLYKLGRIAGMEQADMEACLNDRPMAEALVAEFQKNSETDKIRSTPSFVINGTLHSNEPYNKLKDILEEAGAV